MKFLRQVSDLHLDRDTKPRGTRIDQLWYPPPLSDDLETTFVIAGDLWEECRFITRKLEDGRSWIATVAEQFKYVVFVLGNHDLWGRNLPSQYDIVKQKLKEQGLHNVFLLERDVVVLDQVKFVGGTLWTDYNKRDPMVMLLIPGLIKDQQYINFGGGYRKTRPEDFYNIHIKTRDFIFANATRDDPDQKVVVITHHAPSRQSVASRYLEPQWDVLNYGYYTDLETRIHYEGQDIDYWFHGHMHHTDEYFIGDTKVVLHARGSPSENAMFDSVKQIAI